MSENDTTHLNLHQDQNASSKENSSISSVAPKLHSIPVPIIIAFLIFLFLGGLLLEGLYFQKQLEKYIQPQQSTSSTSTNQAPLIIGTDPTDPPMEYINKQGGLVGYDIDLGYRLGNELGRKVEIRNISWDTIFTALLDKKIDMIISSVTITDERKQKYAFSEPYINAGQVIISSKDAPIQNVESLRGKRISVAKNTTNELEAKKYTAEELIIKHNDLIEATKTLSTGKADAMICDLVLAQSLIKPYKNLTISSEPFTSEYYGIVVRKEDTELLNNINHALAAFRIQGYLTDLKQKWLE
jgi:polar amino acid transport system substrate-binding protein